jgi:hypothetical protein
MEREIERFEAQTENGTVLTVVIFQEFVDATAMGDTAQRWIPGMKRIELDDGSPLNFIDNKTFRLVLTDQIVRRIDR